MPGGERLTFDHGGPAVRFQQIIEIEDGARRVYVEGRGAGTRVLALHGVGGGAYFFRDLAVALGARYRIEAVDLPGTGRSRGFDPWFSFDTWISGLGLVLNDEAGPAFLIGHSLGTILALELWRRWPDRVRGIIFVGGLPQPRPAIRERLTARVAAVREQGTLEGWGPKVSPGIFSPQMLATQPETIARFERRFEGQDADAYLRSLELLVTADASDAVPMVTVPCASISGADDLYAPPADVAAFLARLPRPAESVILPGVGHMPFFEAPRAFAGEVGRVLDGWRHATAPR